MLTTLSLIVAALFLLLGFFTSETARFETVDGDMVSTRQVFLIIALVASGFFFWSFFL